MSAVTVKIKFVRHAKTLAALVENMFSTREQPKVGFKAGRARRSDVPNGRVAPVFGPIVQMQRSAEPLCGSVSKDLIGIKSIRHAKALNYIESLDSRNEDYVLELGKFK